MLFSILEDIFRPFIHGRIYSIIMQELRSHEAFQVYRAKCMRDSEEHARELGMAWEYSEEEDDQNFLSALAEALAVRLGMDNYRNWS